MDFSKIVVPKVKTNAFNIGKVTPQSKSFDISKLSFPQAGTFIVQPTATSLLYKKEMAQPENTMKQYTNRMADYNAFISEFKPALTWYNLKYYKNADANSVDEVLKNPDYASQVLGEYKFSQLPFYKRWGLDVKGYVDLAKQTIQNLPTAWKHDPIKVISDTAGVVALALGAIGLAKTLSMAIQIWKYPAPGLQEAVNTVQDTYKETTFNAPKVVPNNLDEVVRQTAETLIAQGQGSLTEKTMDFIKSAIYLKNYQLATNATGTWGLTLRDFLGRNPQVMEDIVSEGTSLARILPQDVASTLANSINLVRDAGNIAINKLYPASVSPSTIFSGIDTKTLMTPEIINRMIDMSKTQIITPETQKVITEASKMIPPETTTPEVPSQVTPPVAKVEKPTPGLVTLGEVKVQPGSGIDTLHKLGYFDSQIERMNNNTMDIIFAQKLPANQVSISDRGGLKIIKPEVNPEVKPISQFEKAEFNKTTLTNLQESPTHIYFGIRNPEVLSKIKEAGALLVNKTSERMGVFGTKYPSIAKDYSKNTDTIIKIPMTDELQKNDISNETDKRLKQVRFGVDVPLENAQVLVGDKWIPFKEWKPEVKLPEKVQPPVAQIPKELEPLAEEARKYKSAEEFIKADAKTLNFNKWFSDVWLKQQDIKIQQEWEKTPTTDVSTSMRSTVMQKMYEEQYKPMLYNLYNRAVSQPVAKVEAPEKVQPPIAQDTQQVAQPTETPETYLESQLQSYSTLGTNFEDAFLKAMTELSYSEPGYRYRTNEGQYVGVPASFPKWLPEEFRSNDLIAKVARNFDVDPEQHTVTIAVPKNEIQKRLLEIIINQIERYAGLSNFMNLTDIPGGTIVTTISPSNLSKEVATNIKPQQAETMQPGAVSLEPLASVLDKFKALASNPFQNPSIDALQKFREVLAKVQRTSDIFMKDSVFRERAFGRMTYEQRIAFIDNMETGKPQENETLDKIAQYMRSILADDYTHLKDIRSYMGFVKDYFPHIWKDPTKAQQFFASHKSLRGNAPFLKQRIIPLVSDGIKAGLVPMSDNPEDLFAAYHLQAQKYIILSEWWESNQNKKFVKFGDQVPDGYMRINDSIANVLQYSETEKGLIQRGFYVLPTKEANFVNNYLSAGLSQFPLFRGLRTAKNVTNALQLGFSGFHALMTGFNVGISTMARGIMNVKQGITDKSLGTLGRGLGQIGYSLPTFPIQIIRSLYIGTKMNKEWLAPGTMGSEITDIVQKLEEAGGRAGMSEFYSIANKSWTEIGNELRAWRISDSTISTILKLMHYVQAPILQYYVPRMKLGVFYDEISDWMLVHSDASEQDIKIEAVKIWDSVDNRFGELVYDNLMWNKTVKDTLMLGTRALGWNIGNVRELGGGAVNLATGKITKKSSYLIALFLFMGIIGYIYERLKGVKISSLLDLYAPRTGKTLSNGSEERIVFPSYAKDILSLSKQGIWTTAKNKLNPDVAIALDIMQNADYYGTQIRDPLDPKYKQAIDVLDYILHANLPFSLTGYQQRIGTGTTPAEALLSFLGINPAPSYIDKSNIQQIITDLYIQNLPKVTSQTESLRLQARSDVRIKIFNHTATAQDINDLIAKGYLQQKDAAKFVTDSLIQGDIRQFSGLSRADQIKVLNLCTKEERNRYIPYVN